MTWFRFLTTTFAIVYAGSCDRKPDTTVSPFEFHHGFKGMTWGSTRTSLDSLIGRTGGLKIVSDLDETPGQRITVVRDSLTDYYLEWSPEGRFNGLSTIRESADRSESDSLLARLERAYGPPGLTARHAAYVQRRWQTEKLSIEVITTERFHSLKVHHP